MTNTAQSCELALSKLASSQGVAGHAGDEADSVENLLRVTRDGAIFGFHMCRTVLLQSSLLSGRYCAESVEFEARPATVRTV